MIFSNFAFSIAFAGFINAKALARLGVGSFLSLSLALEADLLVWHVAGDVALFPCVLSISTGLQAHLN